jgi:hypothetical protein
MFASGEAAKKNLASYSYFLKTCSNSITEDNYNWINYTINVSKLRTVDPMY